MKHFIGFVLSLLTFFLLIPVDTCTAVTGAVGGIDSCVILKVCIMFMALCWTGAEAYKILQILGIIKKKGKK